MNHRIFPDWITAYLEYRYNTEPPTSYNHWCAISAICAALRRKCFYIWERERYPNLYILLVGPAGRCRKGTSMQPVIKLIRQLNIPMAAERITPEALIVSIYNSLTLTEDTRDPTLKHSHCSMTVTSPEFSVFLGYKNYAYMMDLVDLFDCADHWEYRTKNSGEYLINNVFLNILGATTPELIQLYLPQDAVGAGLTSRMIFVYADKPSKRVAIPIETAKERQMFLDLYHDLECISLLSGEFKLTECYKEVYTLFYEDHCSKEFKGIAGETLMPPPLIPYIQRRPRHIQTVAMCYAASRSNDMIITGQDLADAVEYVTLTEKQMPFAFTGYGSAKDAGAINQMLGQLAALGKGGMVDRGEFFERMLSNLDIHTLDKLLKKLEDDKVISTLISPTGNKIVYNGRPDKLEPTDLQLEAS